MSILQQSFDILDRAYATYRPRAIFSLFSGGDDSLVTLAVAREWASSRGVHLEAVHINTKTGIEETRAFVYQATERLSIPLREYANAENYEAWVLGGGFPGPAQHHIMYNRLKDRSLAVLTRDAKIHRRDKLLFIAGARRQESIRRMGTTQECREDPSSSARVWVNALYYWSKDDTLDYKEAHRLPSNPVVDLIHVSGECGCGCYAAPGEREERFFWFPKWGAWVQELERAAVIRGWCWRWGEAPPAWSKQVNAGQQWLGDEFSPLCSSCELRRSP